jgi:hypothetical protein
VKKEDKGERVGGNREGEVRIREQMTAERLSRIGEEGKR